MKEKIKVAMIAVINGKKGRFQVMKFIKLAFLAVLCFFCSNACFASNAGLHSCSLTCPAGQKIYYFDSVTQHWCNECPKGCYCEGTTGDDDCSGLRSATCHPEENKICFRNGSCYQIDRESRIPLSGMKLCPSGFPYTYQDGDSNFHEADSKTAQTDCCNKVTIMPGKYIHQTSGEEKDCEKGFYCPGKTDAKVCYNGSQQSRGLWACKQGYHKVEHYGAWDGCTECEEGTWSDKIGEGNTKCQDASVGSCAIKDGRCAGLLSNATGATNESICDAGTCSAKGDSCMNGRPGGSYCKTCDPGQCSSKDGVTCASNQMGASHCITCPGGTVNDTSGQSACTPCPAGTAPNTERTQCEACDGYIKPDGKCDPNCPLGYECHDGVATQCTGNTIGVNGVCTPCYGDQVADRAHTRCMLCNEAGIYSTGEVCTKCPGYAALTAMGALFIKESGKQDNSITSCRYYLSGSSVSDSLPETMTDNVNNLNKCSKVYFEYNITSFGKYIEYKATAKENDYVSITSGATRKTIKCLDCPDDKPYSDGGTSACHACDAGYCYLSPNTAREKCKKCSAGFFCPKGNTKNDQLCGDFSNGYALTPEEDETNRQITLYGITPCPLGYYSTGGAGDCSQCAAKYTTFGGADNGCRKNGKACFTPAACVMKDVHLSIFQDNRIQTILDKYPKCIIADKVDRTILQEFKPNE